MKYIFLLLLLPFGALSQITLSETDFATGGDTVRMSVSDDFNVDYASTGSNWTWDFSSLNAESQFLLDYTDMSQAPFFVNIVFGTFANPSYQASYFMANDDIPLDQAGNFLPVSIGNIQQYTKVDTAAISSLGFTMEVEGNALPFKSDTIEVRYELPLTYQDQYSSRGYTQMDLNPIQDFVWRQYRQRYSDVDGYGMLTTPYGTFETVRVKHLIQETDSLYVDLFGFATWIPLPIPDAYIYEWWTTGEKEALLRIETSEFGGNETVTNVEYKDNYNSALLSVNAPSLESIEVYPNPVVNELHLKGVHANATYVIFDMNGRTVLNGQIGSSEVVDVLHMLPGNYLLVVKSEGRIFQTTFVKD